MLSLKIMDCEVLKLLFFMEPTSEHHDCVEKYRDVMMM
jgi:hypothetical protein